MLNTCVSVTNAKLLACSAVCEKYPYATEFAYSERSRANENR